VSFRTGVAVGDSKAGDEKTDTSGVGDIAVTAGNDGCKGTARRIVGGEYAGVLEKVATGEYVERAGGEETVIAGEGIESGAEVSGLLLVSVSFVSSQITSSTVPQI
jgi:hypothetical protein